MQSFIYRVALVAKESKTRGKVLSELETTSKETALAERKALGEMIGRDSWRIDAQIIVTRATVSDFEPYDFNDAGFEEPAPPASP